MMSDRYLFRGKRRDNGELVFGDYARLVLGGNIHYYIVPLDDRRVEVIPETVGQCCWTLKDSTNVFVGDRVKVKGMLRVGIYETTIIECKQGFTLKNNKTYLNNDACFSNILEVIGSIHD